MRLVVLGDLHFYQLAVWPWQLLSKRLLGQTNLWLNRRRHFKPTLWPHIRSRILELKPEGLLCSGDLTTTALPGEFARARTAWSELVVELPSSDDTARMVPGNHDRYTFPSMRKRLFEQAFEPWTSATWPAAWPMGRGTHVIGLDPTRPNKFNASGKLGQTQLESLRQHLTTIPRSDRVIILCHYPIGTPPDLPREAPGHGLQDAQALRKLLAASHRPVLYIHGHIHWPWVWTPEDAPNVITINAGAPMLTSSVYPHGQGLLELDLQEDTVTIIRHTMRSPNVWQTETHTCPVSQCNSHGD